MKWSNAADIETIFVLKEIVFCAIYIIRNDLFASKLRKTKLNLYLKSRRQCALDRVEWHNLSKQEKVASAPSYFHNVNRLQERFKESLHYTSIGRMTKRKLVLQEENLCKALEYSLCT